jgi:hypothetical protein
VTEAAVAAAAEQLRRAMIEPDAAMLDALLAPELSYGHSSGKIDTKASFIAGLLGGASDFLSISISGQDIRLVQDAALVRHTLSAVTNDNGKPGSVTIRILQVWQLQHGRWKLIARQAVRPPL